MSETRYQWTPPPTPKEDPKEIVQYIRRLNTLLPQALELIQRRQGVEKKPTSLTSFHSEDPLGISTSGKVDPDQPQITLEQKIDNTESAGVVVAPTLTDEGGDDLGWTEFTYLIRKSDDATNSLYYRTMASGTVEITQNATRYVGVEYNSGSPQVVSRTSDNFNKGTDEFRIATVYNEGGTLHIKPSLQRSGNFQYWVTHRLQEVEGLKRAQFYGAGGLVLADSADDNQNVTMSAGELYEALQEYSISAFDSSGADTFDIYYRDGGGGWTKVAAQSTWPNTQYDDGDGGLGTIGANWFANLWFYVETDGNVVMLYGWNNYATLAKAREETPPTSEPPRLVLHGTLLGRFIIESGDTTATEVQSFFPETFASVSVTHHHALAGLSDDDHGQYFHIDGRAGGQDAYGGTAANNDLVLASTSHTTNGDFTFGTGNGTNPIQFITQCAVGVPGTCWDAVFWGQNDLSSPVSYAGIRATISSNAFGAESGYIEIASAGPGGSLTWARPLTSPMSANLDMGGYDITNVDDIIGNGGSKISGGDGSGDDLYLQSTTHATHGNIYLGANDYYDEVNEELHIHTTPATAKGLYSGNAFIGGWNGSADYAVFCHSSVKGDSNSPAVMQYSNGEVYFRVPTGRNFNWQYAGAARMAMDNNGSTLTLTGLNLAMANHDITGVDDITGNGGSIFSGGTGSGDDLYLQSTTHATHGKIYFGASDYYDENLGELFINTALTAEKGIASGPAFIGGWLSSGTSAIFTHNDLTGTAGAFALLQDNSGNTYLNAASTKTIYFRVNNATEASLTATALDLANNDITGVDDITGNGGSIISGGTGSGDSLYLQSTTHATKGTVFADGEAVLKGAGDRCRVHNSGAQTINTATWTALTFDSERFDPNGMHSVASNTSRITITDAGLYLVGGNVSWATNASDQTRRIASLSVNGVPGVGTEIARQDSHVSTSAAVAITGNIVMTLWNFSASDYVELCVYQDSGGNLNTAVAASYAPEFWIQRVV